MLYTPCLVTETLRSPLNPATEEGAGEGGHREPKELA